MTVPKSPAVMAPTALTRAVAVALALGAAAPGLSGGSLFVAALAVLGAWWAGPVVAARPVRQSAALRPMLVRHRNTVFAAGCVLLAAVQTPPLWLAGCVTALLLGYLLLVDAFAAGPAGVRQWRARAVPAAAYGASALVLAAACLPLDGLPWGRAVAALAVVGSAAVAGLALWTRAGDA
ncbi:hypothetical protein [Kitasatospora sp. McL0602]|uniref:hypothetical protein n=1 Tax=Kitasatospora sp. McL0602 TaxID=3439530 RepID=UPI003F8C0B4D